MAQLITSAVNSSIVIVVMPKPPSTNRAERNPSETCVIRTTNDPKYATRATITLVTTSNICKLLVLFCFLRFLSNQ